MTDKQQIEIDWKRRERENKRQRGFSVVHASADDRGIIRGEKHDREVHASILGLLSGEESISRKQSVVSDATESAMAVPKGQRRRSERSHHG